MATVIPEITRKLMKFMESNKRTYIVGTKGANVEIRPCMFPPESPYSYSTRVLLDTLDVAGQSVLEVGTGSGVISVVAAKQGARVDGVDILPECIRTSLDNSIRNKVFRETRFFYSDMFSNVRDRYDVIIANLPILEGDLPEGNPVWFSLFDPSFKFHDCLFRQARNHSGKIIIAHADIEGREAFQRIEDLAKKYNWGVLDSHDKKFAGQTWRSYTFGGKNDN